MARTTLDFGIDLGTTNSEIAVFDNGMVEVIKNEMSMEYTPSAVHIDRNDKLHVGQLAKNNAYGMEKDNTQTEFKLHMGTRQELPFKRSGRSMLPEELSAEVLKSLKSDVMKRRNEEVTGAVITVPAAFELPQCDATSRAARLAGFEISPLITEPTAAAMAYAFKNKSDRAYWLVFDLGGGTFDSALIQLRDGNFQIVNHAGDNYLGGKLIDWALVDQLFIPAIEKEYHLEDFNRKNPKWQSAFAKLKAEAEKAKIHLSTADTYPMTIDVLCRDENGEDIPFVYDLNRQAIAKIAEPFIANAINLSKKVLREKDMGSGDIEKVLLVGGPTLAPYLREQLTDPVEGLGIPLDFSMDPLTVVAQGAAYFAATQPVKASSAKNKVEGEYQIDLAYDPIGNEDDCLVQGTVSGADGMDISGLLIEFTREKTETRWTSGKIQLNEKGIFSVELLTNGDKNTSFSITLTDRTGKTLKCTPSSLQYTLGIVPTAETTIHDVGVGMANNLPQLFFAKGEPLPLKKTEEFNTTIALRKAEPDGFFNIPIIEGENRLADRNILIGAVQIQASEIIRDLPAGSSVEVTVAIDSFRKISTSVFIPILDQEFSNSFDLNKPIPPTKQMRETFEDEKNRLTRLQENILATADPNAQKVLHQISKGRVIENLEDALGENGVDPLQAQKQLVNFRCQLDEIEDNLQWPMIVADAEQELSFARNVVEHFENPSAKAKLDRIDLEVKRAVETRNSDKLKKLTGDLITLKIQLLREDPGFWVEFFKHLYEDDRDKMTNPALAERLFNQGFAALDGNDLPKLQNTVHQLLGLLPDEIKADENRLISGVQK